MPKGGGGDSGGGDSGGPVVKQRTRSVKGRRVARKTKRRAKPSGGMSAMKIGEKKKKQQEGNY
tara:strand:- start:4170 stop:4358 length:189 start_codon:yes stop_codon:yes gene_type:complete